jgi:Domain of unknown function (DUF2804), N-terminal/Domain of unknown function (DUF2804), C-terminal
MKRRDFFRAGTVMGAGLLSQTLNAKEAAPPYMPILKDKMAKEDYKPYYNERELTEPVLLCDEKGNLNPDAIGWSRVPLVTANMKGHYLRKKKWNFWNWISKDFVFSITIAHIDYAYFCAVSLTDFVEKKNYATIALNPFVKSSQMPEEVEESILFAAGGVAVSFDHRGDSIKVDCQCKLKGKELDANFTIIKPKGHETLNIVAPWSNERFQMNSKHSALPTEGSIRFGDKEYIMIPDECHAVQDFGRGMWPYRSHWNWAVCTGVQDGIKIGVNMGDKWTTGTGANENSICYDGKLYKVMEDLKWEYDPNDWMKPWTMKTEHSDMIDLEMTPIFEQNTTVSLGVLGTGGICCFGPFNGTIKFDGKTVEIKDMIGWAEEFIHRW